MPRSNTVLYVGKRERRLKLKSGSMVPIFFSLWVTADNLMAHISKGIPRHTYNSQHGGNNCLFGFTNLRHTGGLRGQTVKNTDSLQYRAVTIREKMPCALITIQGKTEDQELWSRDKWETFCKRHPSNRSYTGKRGENRDYKDLSRKWNIKRTSGFTQGWWWKYF